MKGVSFIKRLIRTSSEVFQIYEQSPPALKPLLKSKSTPPLPPLHILLYSYDLI